MGACERLANYAQPFAIGAVPLFSKADAASNEGIYTHTNQLQRYKCNVHTLLFNEVRHSTCECHANYAGIAIGAVPI